MSIPSKKIDLPRNILNKDTLTVCAVQMKFSFTRMPSHVDSDMSERIEDGMPILTWNSNPFRQRVERIRKFLQSLTDFSKKRHIDILVFPEYCFESSMLNILKNYSEKNNVIIIANYYDTRRRWNITLILLPDGTSYEQYKLSKSDDDRSYLSDTPEDKKIIYKFFWEHNSGESCFQIFPCVDFLKYAVEHVEKNVPGIVFVPMCSSKIRDFEGLSSYLIRLGCDCDKNKAIVLANTTSPRKIQKIRDELNTCGLSQVIAPSKQPITKLPKFFEGGIIADINPNNSFSTLTPLERENWILNSLVTFKIKDEGCIGDVIPQIQTGIALNPNIISHLGLKKIYTFYKVDRYHIVKPAIQPIPISCNGIFGVYDILFQSFEEDLDFFQLRLEHYMGKKVSFLKEPAPFPITDVYKFRGKILVEQKIEEYTPIYESIPPDYIEKHKYEIRNILVEGKTSSQNMEEFLNK